MPELPKRRPPLTPKTPRKTTTERGYGWEHQQQRERLMRIRPVCERCSAHLSEHLHHKDRNQFNRSDDNAEMICRFCHIEEHRLNS